MTHYLITFSDDSLTFPADELRDVVSAAAEVVAAAREAGVWVIGGGLKGYDAMVVEPDGTLIPSYGLLTANVAGFSIVDVATAEEAHAWARRIAEACRCAVEVRELLRGDSFVLRSSEPDG